MSYHCNGLACIGIDADKTFFTQSDIPEITELAWILSCVTEKGLLNVHMPIKLQLIKIKNLGKRLWEGISLGYFVPAAYGLRHTTPNATHVPVGKDQQHLEITRDIALKLIKDTKKFLTPWRGSYLQIILFKVSMVEKCQKV